MSRFTDRFETVPGQHKPRPIRNGIIFVAVLMLVAYSGFTRTIPFMGKDGDLVKAHFDRATNVITGNAVRVNGVDVGQVTKIERDDSGKGAIVTMRVKEEGFKLHSDARAGLYWRTLLARNMYIELTPGSSDMPELGDKTIPMQNTESQVEFDELLDSYQEDGREGVRTFFQEGDRTLQGDELGTAIDRVDPGLKPVAPAMTAFRGTRPGKDLPQLADSAAATLAALAKDESALGGIIDHAATVFGVTAARRADLAGMLQKAPASLRETRVTLRRLRTTLDILDPIAADLRPGLRATDPAARKATSAFAAISALTPKALPALRDLKPALTNLASASRQGSPLFERLDPTLARLEDEVIPFLEKRDATTELRNVEAIGPFFGALASSSSQFDANGHMQRFMPGQGLDSLGPVPCQLTVFDPESDGDLLKCKQALRLLPQIVSGAPRKGGGRQMLTGRSGSR